MTSASLAILRRAEYVLESVRTAAIEFGPATATRVASAVNAHATDLRSIAQTVSVLEAEVDFLTSEISLLSAEITRLKAAS
jgi:uncharacterized small protein (DUF1192 family)